MNQDTETEKYCKSQPLVSVIVPNYNYAAYLPMRMESILKQTFQDFELILLDDASTDASVELLKDYRQYPHVAHVEVNGVNSGSPFIQWMKGIQLARGKYVWIAEADDLADVYFLEECVRWAEQQPDTAFCYVGSQIIDEEGQVSAKDINHWGGRAKREANIFPGKAFAEHNLYWRNYTLNASGVLFRRTYALTLAQSPFLTMRYCGDWMFWFQMALQGSVVEIYRNLNFFRQHPAKVTVSSQAEGRGVNEDIQILAFMESQLPPLATYKKRLRRGLLYKKIGRKPMSLSSKIALFDRMDAELGSSRADYWLMVSNQLLRWIFPNLLTRGRDRLK